ncbi:hypothetical protein [Pseudomonas cavernae]|nr:hypothetical protein [Pseudomonas cavernae]
MPDIQRCQSVATGSTCLKKALDLLLSLQFNGESLALLLAIEVQLWN